MVKVISQEVFNETVIENKELLDLSTEEAIEETIKQFKAQDVSLTNIVKDSFILDEENPVSLLVSKLKLISEENVISSCINELKMFCGRGIEYKILCGKEQVYDVLIEKLTSELPVNLQKEILQFFIIFLDGYPDILDERGCIIFLRMLKSNLEIQKLISKLINITCLKHEANRQLYMNQDIISHITMVLNNKPSKELLCCILDIIPALTREDDIRTEISNRYTTACSLSNNFLKPFCKLVKEKEFQEDPYALEHLLNALCSIIVNNDHCLIFESENCLPILIDLMKKFRPYVRVLEKTFTLLFALAGNDNINDTLMQLNLAPNLAFALDNYINDKNVVLITLKLASKLCLRKPKHAQWFFRIDFHIVLIHAMKVHNKNGPIQVAGCWCIRNMICRNHSFRLEFLVYDTEEVLYNVIKNFREYVQDAKFALIELGCNVKLDEPWVGKEGEKLKHSYCNENSCNTGRFVTNKQ